MHQESTLERVEPKRIEVFPQGSHDDLLGHGAWEKTRSFMESLGADKKRKDADGTRTLV